MTKSILKLNKNQGTIFWVLIGAVFFIPFIGNVHLFDWDEINFAEIAREMFLQHHYSSTQINFAPFTEKPPLFFWIQALSMQLFGVNEFAARFPDAILGVIVLPVLFRLGTNIRNTRVGMLWALIYFGTILSHLYFKSGIIDPYFNFFIFLAFFYIFKTAWRKENRFITYNYMVYAGVFTALAILTKGPVAVLVIGLTLVVLWAIKKFSWYISFRQLLVYGITTLIITGIWFFISYLQDGGKFIIEFTIRQWALLTTEDAGHGGFLMYHFVVLFFGCFPASVFMIHAMLHRQNEASKLGAFKLWATVLFWVVLLLFTLVNTKIVHYSSLCYYPMTFLAAVSIENLLNKKWRYKKWVTIVNWLAALPFLMAPFAISYFTKHMSVLKELAKQDPFAVENFDAPIQWSGFEFLPGIFLLGLLIFYTFLIKQKEIKKAFVLIFAGTACWVQLSLFFYVKNIEGYSQRANIEFWQSKAKEDCYFVTFGYKSYTQFFYGSVKPQANKDYTNDEWLLLGKIDKPVYISCKTDARQELQSKIKDAHFLYNSNGFYFFKRMPETVNH